MEKESSGDMIYDVIDVCIQLTRESADNQKRKRLNLTKCQEYFLIDANAVSRTPCYVYRRTSTVVIHAPPSAVSLICIIDNV